MESLDVQVWRTLKGWRQAGRAAVLVTVVRTWGSSPRPVGSIMALRDDGVVVGSVSGGCIEDDLSHRLVHDESLGPLKERFCHAPERVAYGVTADEAHRFGLPCGGTLEMLIEFNPDAQSLEEMVRLLDRGALVRRTVQLHDGVASLAVVQALGQLSCTDTALANTFGPAYRMLLIGAGQMTEYLATMAVFSGFKVTVCDPRESYSASWSVPGVQVVTTMPDDAVVEFEPDPRSCVVALSHDPKLDDMALLEALHSDAFYVGAIGSRRNNQARRRRMIEHLDQTAECVARLRGPIGIYIGSKTPPEIAVSVMAEILAVKNGVPLLPLMEVAQAKSRLAFETG